MTTKEEYYEAISVLADEIHNAFISNPALRCYNIRYNPQKGAYVSFDDYSDDIIILRPDDNYRNLNYEQLKSEFIHQLGNKPFFALERLAI